MVADFCSPSSAMAGSARVALAASQFSLIANTLQQGELHNAVQNLAGRVIRKGVPEGTPGADPVLGPTASARDRSR